ncbi:hypothetical protein [endosymbiont 'TC1' of Trimyema compressum]|uniref:hypothetical protein n=1 Tax=endosymbiont 'TC1' of Trimyema compressum TaxID=243899 RepID=UPI00155EE725|nr:hypothetical protein [endosymbiont 'TC1' of Trimyema compressum]
MDNNVLSCEELQLEYNELTDITGIDAFTNLKRLYLKYKNLTSLPLGIGNLNNLKRLRIIN